MLSPHGHVEHHALVAEDGTTTWLDTEPGAGARAARRTWRGCGSSPGSSRATPPPTGRCCRWSGPTRVAASGVERPGAARRASRCRAPKFAAGTVPARPTTVYDVRAAARGRLGPARAGSASTCWCPARRRPTTVVAAPGRAAGRVCGPTRRCGSAARRPRLGWETDHRTIPAEVGLLAPAVHLDKGCYRGQETVARVHHLGRAAAPAGAAAPRRRHHRRAAGAGHPGDAATAGRSVSSAPRCATTSSAGRARRGQAQRARRRAAAGRASPTAAIDPTR